MPLYTARRCNTTTMALDFHEEQDLDRYGRPIDPDSVHRNTDPDEPVRVTPDVADKIVEGFYRSLELPELFDPLHQGRMAIAAAMNAVRREENRQGFEAPPFEEGEQELVTV